MTTLADPAADTSDPAADTSGRPADAAAAPDRSRLSRLLRGPEADPSWARPGLLGLLAATAVLYLWDLGASGWANAYYSAAVQAGSSSWKAFFFGSFDASSAITVDKTPASLWVMDLSARLFGVNAWSILVPQALAGVAAVGLLYAAVRRHFGPAAGLLAGAVLATTPIATLMFRFNNPDALLVLLLVAAAYATLRALERASTRWLLLAGVLVGAGFMTKMLQAFLVLPALALVYLFAAPTSLGRRLGQLLAAGVALVVSAGWWVAAVALVPASARPYIGGSQTNSVLELALGYNGLGRLTGNETGSVGGRQGPGGGGMWGQTGWGRLFDAQNGSQASWLIPAALVLLGGLLWLSRALPRTDVRRAALLLWGGWLVVTGVVFSYMQGIFHGYYTVALAPAVGALVGIGAVGLWQARRLPEARFLLAGALALTGVWSFVLLRRTPSWHPELRGLVLLVGLTAAGAVAVAPWLHRRAASVAAAAALAVALAGPVAFSLSTAATAHTGAIPTAGPAATGGGFPGRGPGAFGGRPGGQAFPGGQGLPGGQGFAAGPSGQRFGGAQGQGRTGRAGGLGGLLDAATPDSALVSALRSNASSYSWAAATVGANNAAGAQLASGEPVMAIGGFNGTDPSPTLAQFQALVAQGRIHYFVSGGGRGGFGGGPGTFGGGMGGSGEASQISAWVQETFAAQTVGGTTVYDLTAATG